MSQLKEYALALVKAICQERIEQHKSPVVATLHDVARKVNAEVQAALDEMVEAGQLHRTENINRIPMYNPINP